MIDLNFCAWRDFIPSFFHKFSAKGPFNRLNLHVNFFSIHAHLFFSHITSWIYRGKEKDIKKSSICNKAPIKFCPRFNGCIWPTPDLVTAAWLQGLFYLQFEYGYFSQGLKSGKHTFYDCWSILVFLRLQCFIRDRFTYFTFSVNYSSLLIASNSDSKERITLGSAHSLNTRRSRYYHSVIAITVTIKLPNLKSLKTLFLSSYAFFLTRPAFVNNFSMLLPQRWYKFERGSNNN